MHQNKEGMNYYFCKREYKFAGKNALCEKKLRVTNKGSEKQHQIYNASKRTVRDALDGKKKQQEVDNASKKKIGIHLKKRRKHQELMKKVKETPDGKKKNSMK